MHIWSSLSLWFMAIFYIASGVLHFFKPKEYIRIIPPALPYPKTLNTTTGLVEILLGLMLLVPACRSLSAWGIILLLAAVFPANIYQLQAKGAGMQLPLWVLWLRLPLQFLLMGWAYSFT